MKIKVFWIYGAYINNEKRQSKGCFFLLLCSTLHCALFSNRKKNRTKVVIHFTKPKSLTEQQRTYSNSKKINKSFLCIFCRIFRPRWMSINFLFSKDENSKYTKKSISSFMEWWMAYCRHQFFSMCFEFFFIFIFFFVFFSFLILFLSNVICFSNAQCDYINITVYLFGLLFSIFCCYVTTVKKKTRIKNEVILCLDRIRSTPFALWLHNP